MKINCHCHIFSLQCVPLEFRKRFFLDMSNGVQRYVHGMLERALPDGSLLKDWWVLRDAPISEIARRLVAEMDEAGEDLCVPLMMDMAYCGAFGGDVMPYEEQIAQTAAAAKEINLEAGRTRMMPFIAADPRRENVTDVVLDALASGAFHGVKIYPVMGYEPNDARLYPIYEHCAAHAVPITTHCQNGGIPGLKDYYHLAAPELWEPVLADFPALTLDLAHNDRTGSSWQQTIERLITTYPNVYTDLSYDLEMWAMPGRYFGHVKRLLGTPKLQDRILYGTDWYMGRCFWTEVSYLKWFEEYCRKVFWSPVEFTEEDLARLMEHNPKRFLGLPDGTGQ